MFKKLISLFSLITLVASPLIFSGCLKKQAKIPYRLPLEVWGVFDDSEAFDLINKNFAKLNPLVTEVKYRKISSNATEYEKELLDAIASGKGPDVFFFHNSWLLKHKEKIAPLPDSEKYINEFRENFVDVAATDLVLNNQIYAQPLYCDTLGLYYNKDLLSQAGITTPPTTWQEVINDVKLLRKVDQDGNITQSGIAMGRSKDPGGINRSSDILMLLMLQGGTQMFNISGMTATFDKNSYGQTNPGESALNFYTQFAKGDSETYNWNSKMDYSIDSFRYGKTAMMINYSYMYDRMKKTDPKLNFDVSTAPQLDLNNKVNFANYWGLAVTANKNITSDNPNVPALYTNENRIKEAWRYVRYVTMKPRTAEILQAASGQQSSQGSSLSNQSGDVQALAKFDATQEYLKKTRKPTARKDLIPQQKLDPALGIFADQALTAKSWLQPDNVAVEDIFTEMIQNVLSGQFETSAALRTAASRVNALVKRSF